MIDRHSASEMIGLTSRLAGMAMLGAAALGLLHQPQDLGAIQHKNDMIAAHNKEVLACADELGPERMVATVLPQACETTRKSVDENFGAFGVTITTLASRNAYLRREYEEPLDPNPDDGSGHLLFGALSGLAVGSVLEGRKEYRRPFWRARGPIWRRRKAKS